MLLMHRWLVWLVSTLSAVGVSAAPMTQATLLLSHEAARPGNTVIAGLRLRMASGWHTYWRNSGDSGAPTTIKWTLPAGVTAAETQWPVPTIHTSDDLVTYGYENEVVLLTPLTLAATPKGALKLSAKVSWLECDVGTCVPGKAEVETALEVADAARPSAHSALIESWQKKLPRADPGLNLVAAWDGGANGDQRNLRLEWAAQSGVAQGNFYPHEAAGHSVKPATMSSEAQNGKIRQDRVVEKLEGDWPTEITGLVVHKSGGNLVGYAVKSLIQPMLAAATSPTPSAENTPASSQAASDSPSPTPAPRKSLIFYLGLALVGGLILNIMPCVLPVIALKILGFVNQSKEAPGRVRMLGLVYGAGVLCSFLVLAGIVIGVMQAGHRASWGMQFGNPQFLVVLTVLVTLVALNLFGLFEVNLGSGAMDAAGQLASKEGAAGAFFNGVLATVLATPCTAPFLGAALGFAFTQPPAIIVLMFLTVGFGLALPYVVLAWQPAWLEFLPKPGAWMEKFKIAMGFPMLATTVWLFQLAANHYGKRSLWLGLFLVLVALAAWIYGEFVQRGGRRRGFAILVTLLLLGGGFAYTVESQLRWRDPIKEMANGSLQNEPDGIAWQKWSPEAVAKARGEGRPVFVDFTADWCVTCKANKKTSIEIPSVRTKVKEINAVPLLGDYTNTPDDITEELAKFDRAGVPLVLVYPREASKPPIVLPEILTPSIVLKALEGAAR